MQLERWLQFSEKEQLSALAAEFARAEIWQNKNKENFLLTIERALEMIDAIIGDSRWKLWNPAFFGLRDEVAKFYVGINTENIGILQKAL